MQKIVAILILFLLSSCEGFIFQEQDNDYIIIDSEQEKIDLLNGIYARLVEVHNGSYLMVLSRSDDINVYINYSFMYPEQTGLAGCSASSGSGDPGFASMTGLIYKNLYLAILNANNLLGQLDEEVDGYLLGETYFLRAYCYFKLARLFGKVPLVTDIDVNYLLEKPTYEEVYDLIEADLLQALELLPETFTGARIPGETPHTGTAKALLAEVYLAMAGYPVNDHSKYSESARLAGEVIQEADYYGYALLDDMGNLWRTEYRHNAENIFGLFYLGGGTEETNNYFGRNYINYYSDYQFKIGGTYHPDFRFFNEFPNNYRKLVSVVTGEYEGISYDTLGGTERSVVFRTYDPLYNACYYIGGAVLLKWIDVGHITREDLGYSAHNDLTLYLLRYAQTLLTYAEAKTRAGELDESCYEAINMVRRRANKIDIYTPSEFDLQEGLSAEQFLDSLLWERAWELFGEPEGRWFDIVRLDLKDEIAAYRYPIDLPTQVPVSQLNEDWYFFLIPADDRWLNPNFTEEDE
jgi:starch-binding outer membrane protein, SusD/RagB family